MKHILLVVLFFTTLNSQTRIVLHELQKHEIMIVYGSDTCHYCIDTKEYLIEKKVDFIYYDIDVNIKKQKEMVGKLKKANISLSNLSLPVIDKNGEVFINKGEFQDFIKKLNVKSN